MQTITYQDFVSRFGQNNNAVVINVLDPEMFRNEHIPGSVNVPLDSLDFLGDVEKVADRDDTIITYCASSECPASGKAAQQLQDAGFRKAFAYEGGVAEWKEKGRRMDSDIPEGTPREEAERNGGEIQA